MTIATSTNNAITGEFLIPNRYGEHDRLLIQTGGQSTALTHDLMNGLTLTDLNYQGGQFNSISDMTHVYIEYESTANVQFVMIKPGNLVRPL